ncbi:MAG TPA: hypothetical protein VLM37_00820, partial [Fibrobacteraceae bacterium]|nr:hypothetical protein [Fibrobacteraceae bacterium]
AGTEYCIIRVTDNDGEIALDTTIVTVIADKPYVHVLKDSTTVTIRDSLKVNAQVIDTLGSITKIEWSCGLPGYAGVSGWVTVSTPDTVFFAPSSAASTYYCIVRGTDDDEQSATDTIRYRVLLDAPRVTVLDDSIDAAIGSSVSLDAIAYDSLGAIIRYEWSCGSAGAGGVTGWTTYSSPEVTVTMPTSGNSNYLCVIRVMDDDSLTARDTTHINIEQDTLLVTVEKEVISARAGENFSLDCSASSKLSSILGYRWSCGTASTLGTTWDPSSGWYQYCGVSETAPSSGTTDYLCVAQVSDTNGLTATDTAYILVVEAPEAIITRSDSTLAIWSQDIDIPDSNRYWSTAFNGASSITGSPLGNSENRQFWWNFSHYNPESWYLGPEDGTLDITYSGFDEALERPSSATAVTVSLDFRDSTLTGESDSTFIQDFLIRHKDMTSTTITFKRFWQNLGSDTVIQTGAHASVAVVASNDGPFVAFRDSSTGYGYVMSYSGSSWSIIGGGAFSGTSTADSVRIARSTSTGAIYVAYFNSGSGITVKEWTSDANAWTTVGGGTISISGTLKDLAIAAKGTQVAVAWLAGSSSYKGYVQTASESGNWGWGGTSGSTGAATNSESALEIRLVYNPSTSADTLAIGYINASYAAKLRYAYGTNLTSWGSSTITSGTAAATADMLSMAYGSNGRLWFAFNNRTSTGLRVRYWSAGSVTDPLGDNIGQHQIGRATSIAVDSNNYPVVAYDDNYFNPNISVWHYDGSNWLLLGENLLPYFKALFYSEQGYYLRATFPSLAISPAGTIYLGMNAMDSRSSGTNNGPIVMEFAP